MNTETPKIDSRLRSIIINAFSVARWAYGAQAVGEEPAYAPPTILLISKGSDGYDFRGLDENSIPHERGKDRTEEVADECMRLLIWGLTDYVLTVQECAMFVGTDQESEIFHQQLQEKGSMFHPDIQDQIQKCCSFALYDISGVIVRTFATDLCCVRTFMMNTEIEDLLPSLRNEKILPQDDTRMSTDVSDLSNNCWVMDECVPEELRDRGPMPSWSETLERVLARMDTIHEQ